MKKRTCSIHRFVCVAWLLAIGSSAYPEEVTPQLFHCRLIWKSHPSTQATVSWSTRFAGPQHEVRFRERHSDHDFSVVACHHNARFGRSAKDDPTYFHHALMTALTPDTEYEIIVCSTTSAGERHRSQPYYFRTAPRDSQPVSILFGGDSRSNRPRRQQMNRFIAKLSEQSETKTDASAQLIALAHVGDYVKNGLDFEQWHAWLSDHEITTNSAGRLLPLIPTRGNHDRGLLYGEVFDFDVNDDNYFVTQLSPLAALITLNTEASMAGDQAKWLRCQLATMRPAHRWLLAQYHRPAYPAVGFPSGALSQWVPHFDKFNLDLACEGDGHVIKRTLPIRENRYDESGVVYIGEGGLAVGQRQPKLDRWYLQPPGSAGRGHHIQRITFHPDRLTYECLLVDGQVIDAWHRERTSSQP